MTVMTSSGVALAMIAVLVEVRVTMIHLTEVTVMAAESVDLTQIRPSSDVECNVLPEKMRNCCCCANTSQLA